METQEELRQIALKAYGRDPKRNNPRIVLEIGIKKCYSCDQWKRVGDFGVRSLSRDGRNTMCHLCRQQYMEGYRSNNREKIKEHDRTRNVKRAADPNRSLRDKCRQYGITEEQYWEVYHDQGGRCAICRRPESDFKKKLAFDHDHSCCPPKSKCCGKCFRGLLCFRCNAVLLVFFEDEEVLDQVGGYLGRDLHQEMAKRVNRSDW